MAKLEKLISRFKSRPSDFSWNELVTLLERLGFYELQGGGSRVKFFHKKLNCLIQLHKPHPAKTLKHYMVKEVLNVLVNEKLI